MRILRKDFTGHRTMLLTLFILVIIIFPNSRSFSQDPAKPKVYTNREDNAKCLKCHGSHKFTMVNQEDNKPYTYRMPSDYVIDTAAYFISNHWNFKCIDCHTEDYINAPHNQTLRFQQIPTCLDCHGGDANFAKYNFEGIDTAFQKSVHFKKHSSDFNCWSCHDAHTYKINARNKEQTITKTVAYDNAICLSCHANFDKYQLLRDTLNPNVIAKHDWLPNQLNHFTKVRCIECHANHADSILVSHQVMPKSKAVRNCVQCHSTNSMLLKTLYKYQIQEKRSKNGFLNANMMSELYVVGANKNIYLNILSIIIVILTLAVISIHAYFRIKR